MSETAVHPTSKLEHLWGRRELFTRLGWGALTASTFAGVVSVARLAVRRAPVEDPTMFRAGKPSDYQVGQVSDRFLKTWRVYVVRQGAELYAIYARCTHLGCTPRWYGREDKFKCPCHGSGFTSAGVNFEGPAPRPLERVRVWLDDAGELWIDVGQKFAHTAFDQPGASVKLPSRIAAIRGGGRA